MSENLQPSRKDHVQRICRMILAAALLFGSVIISATPVSAQASSQTVTSPSSQQKLSAESLIETTKVVIKVVAVKDNAVAPVEYTKPDGGNKFVSVQIVMDNAKGEDEWEVKPDKFILKDAEGNVYETESSIAGTVKITQPTLKSGKVDGGDLVRGWITF